MEKPPNDKEANVGLSHSNVRLGIGTTETGL